MQNRVELPVDTYRSLAEIRYRLRRFLRFSENAYRAAGLEPQQQQCLLAIKGLPEGACPTVGTIAERLQLQHHSAVELLDRMEKRGLISRHENKADRRSVLVMLTRAGESVLSNLAAQHVEELQTHAADLVPAIRKVGAGAQRRVKSVLR